MGHFGVPKVVQSDNGGEFHGVLEELLWKEGIEIAHGRAKHPQSQGSVEQGNGVFKKKLATWRERHNTIGWVSALPFLALAMNKQPHSALPNNMCPYEVMFGRKPRWEHRVPAHVRHMSQVEDQSVSDSDQEEVVIRSDGK
jgi:transposase InsO family protein